VSSRLEGEDEVGQGFDRGQWLLFAGTLKIYVKLGVRENGCQFMCQHKGERRLPHAALAAKADDRGPALSRS
jgi:hypothetical protein